MSKFIVVGAVALVLFGLSAGASYFLKLQQEKARESGEGSAGAPEAAGREAPAHSGGAEGGTRTSGLGRPGHSPEAEATVQMTAKLREQEENLRKREDQLRVRAKHLEIIAQDIRGEREAIDKLHKEISDEVKQAGDKVTSAEQRFEEMQDLKRENDKVVKEMKKSLTEVDAARQGGFRRAGDISDTMNPVEAAGIIQAMADADRIDTAALILANMKQRKAAEVLNQIPDKTLAAQLVEKIISLKQPGGGSGGSPATGAGPEPVPPRSAGGKGRRHPVGLIGALIGLGIPEEEARYYEGEFQAGRTLVTACPEGRREEAADILRRHGARDIESAAAGAVR
jgi:flagellar motility protein MotE (MotC chaperone)